MIAPMEKLVAIDAPVQVVVGSGCLDDVSEDRMPAAMRGPVQTSRLVSTPSQPPAGMVNFSRLCAMRTCGLVISILSSGGTDASQQAA